MYPVRFLRREDTGASRLPDFLHLISEFLLLQGLVRLALTGVVLDRFLQAARTACVHRGRLLISLSFSLTCDFYLSLFFSFFFFVCFLSGSVSSDRGYNLPICACTFTYVCFSLFESDFQTRPPAEFNRERAIIPHRANPACMPDQEERVRRTLRKLCPLSLKKKYSKKSKSIIFKNKFLVRIVRTKKSFATFQNTLQSL